MEDQQRSSIESKPKKSHAAWMLATFFGVGCLKPGPGTFASAVTVLVWLGAAQIFHPANGHGFIIGTAVAALIVTLIGIPVATIVARESGRKDPSVVVIDEVAGQLITLIALQPTLLFALIALGLFRAFDIAKPWPIRRLEALPDGTGIMLDDVAAGLAARLFIFIVMAIVQYMQ